MACTENFTIEIKARARDFNAIRARAAELSDTTVEVIPQVDTFFSTVKGRLKLRELGQSRAQLIYYERPDQEGPKRSDYHIFETGDPVNLKTTLSLALGARGDGDLVRHGLSQGQVTAVFELPPGHAARAVLEYVEEENPAAP